MSCLFAVILLPAVTVVDAGEWSVGPVASGAVPLGSGDAAPVEGRFGGMARFGIGDWLAVDGRVLATVSDRTAGGVGSIGVAAAWDVLAWVPELRLAVGGRLSSDWLRLLGDVGVRRYLSLDSALLLALGGEWIGNGHWQVVLSVGILWRL
ncbi:MAG: hypothetical protein A2341_00680 [Deltaproteobacteria bacterium RIFOXYB12_FULL_58_9]|nr:MAG: hypothetical protein A2341_00680 [Deltaproteobacteria bacterium RIFOXYB12_FULL_58_9]